MNENCRWCGMMHGLVCPLVKAVEYYQDGSIKRVEFKTAVDYPQLPSYIPPYTPPSLPFWPYSQPYGLSSNN